MRRLSALLVVALLAAACADDESPGQPDPTTTSTEVPATTSAAPADDDPAEDEPADDDNAGGNDAPTGPPDEPTPGAEWATTSLTAAGFDEDRFEAAITLADEVDSHCFVVVRDGAIAHEHYGDASGPDENHEVFSVTKSVTAAIVGAAHTSGHLDVGEPASTYIDSWLGTDSDSVTIAQLLQNTSGRFYDPIADLVELGGKPDMTEFAVGLTQQSPPDTTWFYNQAAIQSLDHVLEQATGTEPAVFAEENLFAPLGMSVSFRTDPAGNIPLFAGLQAGCRDLARFGLLSLRQGSWGGDQLIDAQFMADATTGRTDLNRAYGYLYWANAEAGTWDHTDPRRDRSTAYWPDLPQEVFGANGLGGQIAMMVPEHDLVVVRIGPASGVAGYDGILANDLTAAVLGALSG